MSAGLSGVAVLVIEDNEDNRELIVFCLEQEDAIVKTAATLAEARHVLGAGAGGDGWVPSVIVSDMSLPDGDGCELLVGLRKDARFRTVPAIVLTGCADPFVRNKAIAAGFQKHIVKPIDLFDLVASVVSLASIGQSHEPAAAPGVRRAHDTSELRALATRRDARGVLRVLNGTTTHRYTAIFRFENDLLVSVWTYDREAPDADRFPVDFPLARTYCQFARGLQGPFVVRDARDDARLTEHPLREDVRGYCGISLVRGDGSSCGTLCHFDEHPSDVTPEALALLEEAASLLPETLFAPLT